MCGIAGIFAYHGAAPPVDLDELLRVREAMRLRGPDGAGLWISEDGRVGLAHRRLAIIDLSECGAQPMATADGRFRVTFNGEIYNYRALRKELEAKGYRFHSSSDTEVLLQLYADRGERMVHALRGMYAFAIWDERDRSMFLARDPFGIKPLYYADDGRSLRFASQVKALLKGGAVDTAPEPAGSVGFVIWGTVPEPYTLYRGIRSLPAGAHLRVTPAGQGSQKLNFAQFGNGAGISSTLILINPSSTDVATGTAFLFDSNGNFVRVLEQRDKGDIDGKGWHDGGRFCDRNGLQKDTVALSALPTSILSYLAANYSTDTLVKAFQNRHDSSFVVISKNNGLFATVFDSSGNFVKRVTLPAPPGIAVGITQSALPANVLSYLSTTYPDYVFEKAFAVYNNSNVLQGYAVVLNANNTKYAVLFDSSGNFVSVKTIW